MSIKDFLTDFKQSQEAQKLIDQRNADRKKTIEKEFNDYIDDFKGYYEDTILKELDVIKGDLKESFGLLYTQTLSPVNGGANAHVFITPVNKIPFVDNLKITITCLGKDKKVYYSAETLLKNGDPIESLTTITKANHDYLDLNIEQTISAWMKKAFIRK